MVVLLSLAWAFPLHAKYTPPSSSTTDMNMNAT